MIDSEDITIDTSSAITGVERLITLNPKDDAYGTSNITVTITDGLESVSKELTVTMTLEDYPQSTASQTTLGNVSSTTQKIDVRGRGRSVKLNFVFAQKISSAPTDVTQTFKFEIGTSF